MANYKNPISTAMAEYREDFRYNKKWWTERMGTGRNNEYLWVQFKNGDSLTIQADYFQEDGNTSLPRFRANEVAYISRYYGDGCETTTAIDIVVDCGEDTYIKLYHNGEICARYELTEAEEKELWQRMGDLDDRTDSTAWMLDYCRALASAKMAESTKQAASEGKEANKVNAVALAQWIDLQLSTVMKGVRAGYSLGNYNTVWIDRDATTFVVTLANGAKYMIDSNNYNNAESIAAAILEKLQQAEIQNN